MASSQSHPVSKKYEADCQCLHHFFTGNSTSRDAKAVIEIFTQRGLQELNLIFRTYYGIFNRDFLRFLLQQNSTFARVAYLRAIEPCSRDTNFIREALVGRTPNINLVTEVICTRPSSQIVSLKQEYQNRYNSSIDHDVSSKANGSLKEVLLAILSPSNYNGGRVDTTMGICDAKSLFEAVESGQHIDQRSILTLLKQRSTEQLKVILNSYKQLYGYEFMKFLKNERCGEFGRSLHAVVKCVQFPEKHFAEQIKTSLKNGKSREVLVRTVVTRAGIDVRSISQVLRKKTGWSLESLIRNEFTDSSCTDKHSEFVGDFLVALVKI